MANFVSSIYNTMEPQQHTTAKTVLHQSASRGFADHGWLKSFHTFSFAGYQNPERMHFGVLRVLNDDTVSGGMGFGTHPHENMEIISIPLEGDLKHEDSMGNQSIIRQGDIQVMSAGTGVYHSEYNADPDQPVKFLQIWLFPNKQNVTPRYGQMSMDVSERQNKLQQLISPDQSGEGLWIHQDAWFHIGRFDKGRFTTYTIRKPGNGVYAFVLSGTFLINGQELHKRDALGITDTDSFELSASTDNAEILLIDIPMELHL